VDIGTGGGFPGIPLAIFFPEVTFTLVDSIGKKIKVVNEVADAIGLKNVITVHGRVEELKGRYFDFAVSRAVAPLGDLWTWIQPFLRKGHKSEELPNGLICLKGGDLKAEIEASGMAKVVQAWSVHDIFEEPEFDEKFLLFVPRL
jgi:16S rRNA (guanine527-N7)-methyltransferase